MIRKEENCFVSRRSYRNVNEPALRIVHGVELKARRIKETDSPSAILSGFVAVLFSEIVSAKCKNALPGVVLVIDSAAELDVDVAFNGQFCPTSP